MGFAWRWTNLKGEDANSNGDEKKEITPRHTQIKCTCNNKQDDHDAMQNMTNAFDMIMA